jgi:hydrogenase/urease accessory protein HupE
VTAVLFARSSLAHQASVVYSELVAEGRTLHYTFQISNADLYEAVGVGRDRPVARDEVARASGRVLAYLAARVTVENASLPCEAVPEGLTLADKADGFFAVAQIEYRCKRTLADVVVRYDLFFDVDPRHQGLARVVVNGQTSEHVFRDGARELHLARPVGILDHARDYFLLGVEHIFTGYDHLAFLFGLLVIASARGLRGGLRYILGIVTAFTVAHSFTLIAAGLGWVRLASRIVEPAIALSIAYVALENLALGDREPRRRWLLTFGFGLIHGFGFASVLRDIGLPPRGLVLSLVSFNIGVETGQLAVVAGVSPVLLWLVPRYRLQRGLRRWGSLLLLVLAAFWFFERVLQRSWLGGWLG